MPGPASPPEEGWPSGFAEKWAGNPSGAHAGIGVDRADRGFAFRFGIDRLRELQVTWVELSPRFRP